MPLRSSLRLRQCSAHGPPALRAQTIPVRVTVVNVQGQYATWRATRATGEFDLRTFEVRAVPVQPIEGLRPGMSAIASWAARAR